MLNLRDIYGLQSQHQVSDTWGTDEGIDFPEYVANCRTFLVDNDLTVDSKKKEIDTHERVKKMVNLITEFVKQHPVKVKGYCSDDGIIDTALLLQDLIDSITGTGVLKEAFSDEDIDEIQINDYKTIFVARKGVLEPYIDKKGRVMQFTDDDEIKIMLNKLIDDGTGNQPQFTDGYPIINAKTAKEQYRVNAVHWTANAMDKVPYDFPATTVLIRKFKKVSLTLGDLIRTGSMTESMGKLITLVGRAGLKAFCVGPTGSGKTTLLNTIAHNLPRNMRIILIQNPTEITMYDRDELGRNKWNAVHWEVNDFADTADGTKATLPNLLSNTLRESPEMVIVGEQRAPQEFTQTMRLLKMGQPVLGTFHAGSGIEGVERWGEELGGSNMDLKKVADALDIIIAQHRFPDGSRRVMEISEIVGATRDGQIEVNKLFEFKLTGKLEENPVNGLLRPAGVFEQGKPMSNDLKQKFFKYNISSDDLSDFT